MSFWEDFWNNLTKDPAAQVVKTGFKPANNLANNLLLGSIGLKPRESNVAPPPKAAQTLPFQIGPRSPNLDGPQNGSPEEIAAAGRPAGGQSDPLRDQYETQRRSAIERMIAMQGRDYTFDPNNPLYQNIQGSFDKMQGAVNSARDKSNSNYNTSNNIIAGLFDRGVKRINTDDAAAYRNIDSGFQNAIKQNYDGIANQTRADQLQNQKDQAAIMQRYGLSDSQMVANPESNDVLKQLQTDKAAALQQAAQYGAADQSLNVAAGQAVAGQGLDRQADLRRQLDGILGGLDDKSSQIEMNRANAMNQFYQQDYGNYLKTQDQMGSTIDDYFSGLDRRDRDDQQMQMKLQELAQKAQQGQGDLFGQDVILRGLNYSQPEKIAQLYANVRAQNKFDAGRGQNREDFLLNQMQQQAASVGINWDNNAQNAALEYILRRNSYGTDKGNAR